MIAQTDWVTLSLAIATAIGIVLTGIAAIIGAIRTGRVHAEVTTGNGRTLGQTVSAGAKAIETIAKDIEAK